MYFLLYNNKAKTCPSSKLNTKTIFDPYKPKINFPLGNNQTFAVDEKITQELFKFFGEQRGGQKNYSLEELKEEDKNNNLNKIYTNCQDIKQILTENDFPKEITDKINDNYITNKDKQSVFIFQIKQKRKKNILTQLRNKKKLGRKRSCDNSEGGHNKNHSDNIIKKCKCILFSNLVDYINEYINKYKINIKEDFHLFKLDYGKYISDLKKENEMKIFNTKLKDLASLNTSLKYKNNKDINVNKIKINNILQQEKNNEKINELLHMCFGDWIDVFTFKNKLENDITFNGLREALEKIAQSSDEEYFSRLIFYLFNYKKWFEIRKGRKKNKKIEDNEESEQKEVNINNPKFI